MKDKSEYTVVGIDVAKEELEVRLGGQHQRVPKNPKGFAALRRELHLSPPAWVFCEATGGYERGLLAMLHQHRITVSLLNPARVRAFARSEGVKAKNDPIDTRMIERFALEKNLSPTPPPKHPLLIALMDRRRHLKDELTREKTRLQNSAPSLHASMRRMIAVLQREIAKIETAIRLEVKKHEPSQQAADLMQTVVGVGEVTAWAILAYLPEITQLHRNQLVCLAGLAPFNQDSGKSHGPRKICGGRHKVRDVLYMAATCAATHNPVIKPYVDRLRARGKPYNSACTAAMRKLVIHIQSLLKKQQISLVS